MNKYAINPDLPRFTFVVSALTWAHHEELVHQIFDLCAQGARKMCADFHLEPLPLKRHTHARDLKKDDYVVVLCLNAEAIPFAGKLNLTHPMVLITNQERRSVVQSCQGGKSFLLATPHDVQSNHTSFRKLFTRLCDMERARQLLETGFESHLGGLTLK